MIQKVTLCTGVSYSGKTTWAKEEAMRRKNVEHICLDDIRREYVGVDKWTIKHEVQVKKIYHKAIVDALKDGKHVIVDESGLYHDYTIKILDVISKGIDMPNSGIKWEYEVKHFDITFREASARMKLNKYYHGNEENLKAMLISDFRKYYYVYSRIMYTKYPMVEFTERQLLLMDFVKEIHAQQYRKGGEIPYWTHLYGVASVVLNRIHLDKVKHNLHVETSLLHDMVEDQNQDGKIKAIIANALNIIGYTKTEQDIIFKRLGILTKKYTTEAYPHMNSHMRNIEESKRYLSEDYDTQVNKLADIIHNCQLSDINSMEKYALRYLHNKIFMISHFNKIKYSVRLDTIRQMYRSVGEIKNKFL